MENKWRNSGNHSFHDMMWIYHFINYADAIRIYWSYWSMKLAAPPSTQVFTFQHPNLLTALWWCMGCQECLVEDLPTMCPDRASIGQTTRTMCCCFMLLQFDYWVSTAMVLYGGMTKMMSDHIFVTMNSSHFNIELRRGSHPPLSGNKWMAGSGAQLTRVDFSGRAL